MRIKPIFILIFGASKSLENGQVQRKLDISVGMLIIFVDPIVEKLEALDVTMMLMIIGVAETYLMNVVSVTHHWIVSTMPLVMPNVPIAMVTNRGSLELTWAMLLTGSWLMECPEDVSPSGTRMEVT